MNIHLKNIFQDEQSSNKKRHQEAQKEMASAFSYGYDDDSLEDQKENLLDLIDSYPHGIALKCIHAAYGSKYEEDLQVRKYGYDSVRQFIESLSDDLGICEVGGEVFVKGKAVQNQKKNLLKLIESTSGCMPLKSIHGAYGSMYGENLAVRKHGYDSVQDFIERMSDDFLIDDGQVFVKAGLIEQKKRKLFAMVQRHPNGIPLHLLSSKFWEMYKEELGIKKLGFSSARDFIENMNNELCIIDQESQLVMTKLCEIERRQKVLGKNIIRDRLQTQPSEVNKHMISRSGDGSCSAGTANKISNEGNRSREPGAEENALNNSKSRITHDKGHQILARSEADTMNYAQRGCFCFCLRR
uniref:HTH OST-type domain-containing protein n=1 Tax=Eptatretus burgeri TaxID=7764 RepID=A0A8C4WUC2_EPTBU